jgi:hypothetical protein
MFYKQSVDFTVSRRVQYRHMILKLTTLKHRKLLLLHNNSSSCMSMVIFKHMRTTVINRIYCDSKSRLNLENACYPADQKLLSSFLLLKNIKIKIYSTLNLTAVLYGCETWSLAWINMQSLVYIQKCLKQHKIYIKKKTHTNKNDKVMLMGWHH